MYVVGVIRCIVSKFSMLSESGPTRSLLSMQTARTVVLLAVGGVAIVLLFWMYSDRQLYLSLQHRMEAFSQEAKPATDSTASRDIQVIVKEVVHPALNITTKPPWDYNWDRKAWKNLDDAKSVGVRSIILVRHGQYDLETGLLTEKGRQQANLTGFRLKELGMKYTEIIHSTMIRAKETADLIHAHLPNLRMVPDDFIVEGGPIPPQPTITYWGLSERTYHEDGPRLEAAFRKYFYRADHSQTNQSFQILVGHANIFRFFALRALQLPKDAWMRVFIAHASITLLHINPDGTVSMTKFGDSGHLPPDLVTM